MCSAANDPGDIVASGGSPFRYEIIRVWDQALVISTAGRAFLRPREKKTSREEICQGLTLIIIGAKPPPDLSPARVTQGLMLDCSEEALECAMER